MKKFQPSQYRTEIPVGTFLNTENGYFYVNTPKTRRKFTTDRCLQSWSPSYIAQTYESSPNVAKLKVTGPMKFRDGSLLYSQSDGKMYLVSERKLRHICNPDILSLLGAKREDAVWVSDAELQLHELGEPLN